MNRKWFSILALIAAATFFFNLSSCGFNQHLVSIQVVPSGVTFNSVGSSDRHSRQWARMSIRRRPRTLQIS